MGESPGAIREPDTAVGGVLHVSVKPAYLGYAGDSSGILQGY